MPGNNILDIVYPIARKAFSTMKRRHRFGPFLKNMERPDYESKMDYWSLPQDLYVRMAKNNLNILRNDARYSFDDGEIDASELEERLQDYDDAERDVDNGDFSFSLDNYDYIDDPDYQTYMQSMISGIEHEEYLSQFREYRRLVPQIVVDPISFVDHSNPLVMKFARRLVNGE